MIIVIVISGILLSIMSVFIAQPIQGFIDLSRRATLAYAAENALRRMQRDVRRSLPNSIRINAGNNALELIHTVEGARYRAMPPPGDPDRRLQFNTADTDFDILGNFSADTLVNPNINYVAVYNIGAVDAGGLALAGSNAYGDVDAVTGTNVITPNGYTITLSDDPVNANEDHVNIDDGAGGGFQFTYESPRSRMYLVDTAVSYVCSGGQLNRYTGYDFTNKPSQVVPPVGGSGAILMADNVDSCSFTYTPGTSQRAGLLTLDLTIRETATGEQIRLLQQVHVDNVP
jgi:MSHA biogenesis protein MshO